MLVCAIFTYFQWDLQMARSCFVRIDKAEREREQKENRLPPKAWSKTVNRGY